VVLGLAAIKLIFKKVSSRKVGANSGSGDSGGAQGGKFATRKASTPTPAPTPSPKPTPTPKPAPAKNSGKTFSQRALEAQKRQKQMLKDNVGYNISPSDWDKYPSIGRQGTFVSDKKAMDKLFPEIAAGKSGVIKISKARAADIEKQMGLDPGSLSSGLKIRKIDDLTSRSPRSPMEGNSHFLGAGEHLPGGHPEMVIDSVLTKDGNGVSTLLSIVVGK
jgi:hypothetical protein